MIGLHGGIEGEIKLIGGRHIKPIHKPCKMLHHSGHRIGLDRIMKAHGRRQSRPQIRHAAADFFPIIGIKRRLPQPRRQKANRLATDQKLAIPALPIGKGGVILVQQFIGHDVT